MVDQKQFPTTIKKLQAVNIDSSKEALFLVGEHHIDYIMIEVQSGLHPLFVGKPKPVICNLLNTNQYWLSSAQCITITCSNHRALIKEKHTFIVLDLTQDIITHIYKTPSRDQTITYLTLLKNGIVVFGEYDATSQLTKIFFLNERFEPCHVPFGVPGYLNLIKQLDDNKCLLHFNDDSLKVVQIN